MTSRKTHLTIVIGAIVALTPPILVYLQSRAELRDKYASTSREADAGYRTLVESVRELRDTVTAQHDALTKLQGHVEALEALAPISMRMSSKPLPPPAPAPDFHELPANLDAAQMKR